MTSATPVYSTQKALDERPIGPFQWRVIGWCFFIALLDGFDTQSIAFIGPAIAEEFSLGPADLTWIISASIIGQAVGAMALGTLGDRFGRRPAVLVALLLFGLFSLAAAFATAPYQLVVLRFLIGLGMGGATPALLALAAEYSPLRRRGTVMTLVILGLPGGAMLGGIVAAAWLPAVGWRGIFVIGGVVPLMLLVFSLKLLPESPQFLAAKIHVVDEKLSALLERITRQTVPPGTPLGAPTELAQRRGSVKALFSAQFRAATIGIWVTYLSNWIAWFMFLLWLPTALATAGLSTQSSALGTVTVNAAFIVFAIPLSIILPKVRPQPLLLVMFAVGIGVCLALAVSGQNWALVFILVAAAGFGIGGQQLVLNYLVAITYPTELRSTATGWSIGIGRTGAIIGSSLGGWALEAGGVSGYFRGVAIPLAIAAVAVVVVHARGTVKIQEV